MAVTYTLGQMTDSTLRQLRGTLRDTINILAVALDAPTAGTTETITFSYDISAINAGSLLSVGTETMYVIATTPSNLTCSVIRGYDGTTPATQPIGAQITVDPPWTRNEVQDRLRDEIRSWAPQLFKTAEVQIPVVEWQRGYDLGGITTPIIRILRVTAPQPPYVGAPGAWEVPGTSDISQANPTFPFRFQRNANPVEFPSGNAVFLTGTILPYAGLELTVAYATPFDVDTSWTDATDMISAVGLNESDLDIPPMGAAARLLRLLVARRVQVNVRGQSRDDQAVTVPAILQAATQLELTVAQRKGDLKQRLLTDYPLRSTNF